MQEATQRARVIRFGPFETDLYSRELRKLGIRIKLQDQPFQVLAMLLERPGELVTREEIRAKLWPQNMGSPRLGDCRVGSELSPWTANSIR